MQIDGITIQFAKITHSMPYVYKGLEVVLVVKGSMGIRQEKTETLLEADQMIILDGRELRSYQEKEDNAVVIFRVSEEFLEKNSRELLNCDFSGITLKNAQSDIEFQLKRLFSQMIFQYIQGTGMEFQAYLYHFLFMLYRDFGVDSAEGNNERKKTEHSDLDRLLDFLNEHYYEKISLSRAAELVYMTPQAFSKYFKRSTGTGFLEYLSRIRVEKAMKELLSTDHTITQIASNAGFANDKAFSVSFRRIYGVAPGVYRKRTEKTEIKENPETVFSGNIFECESISEFVDFAQGGSSFFSAFNMEKMPQEWEVPVNCICETEPFPYSRMITVENGLKAVLHCDIRRQLEIVQKDLQFDFVCFGSFDLMEFAGNGSLMFDNDYAMGDYVVRDILCTYRDLHLTPYIRVDMSYIMEVYGGNPEIFYARFRHFTEILKDLPEQFFDHAVRFELCCKKESDKEYFAEFCESIYFSNNISGKTEFGVGLMNWMMESDQLPWLGNIPLTFAGAEFVPGYRSGALSQNLEQKQKDFFCKKLADVQAKLELLSVGKVPVYVTRWNVLAGAVSVEIGTFFRSAIILDALRGFGNKIAGIGFPGSTFQFGHHANELALFSMTRIRRPVFFVLEVVNYLKYPMIFQNEHVIVTKQSLGNYAIALFSPSYVDPALSIDRFFVENIADTLQVTLKNLPAGRYGIKRLIFSKYSTGIYERGRELGLHDFSDPDVIKYLENCLQPELYLYEEESEGELTLHTEVSFNGIVVFLIKNKG